MEEQQITLIAILAMTLALFIYGRWRYDVVSILALLAGTLTGVIPVKEAFLGFGHPAVITVAAVLAISEALQNAGVVDYLYRVISKSGKSFLRQLSILCGLIAVISAFMNNVGALAILLPVTLQLASKAKRSASAYLMPVAFSSLLGGMITMIGTPPNIIVALLREEIIGEPFSMFDFTPVGLGVAIAGLAFLTLFGWRLIPKRKGRSLKEDLFEVEGYLSELQITDESKCIGKTIKELESLVEGDVRVVGIVSGKKHDPTPSSRTILEKNDILIVQADSETLEDLIGRAVLKIVGDNKSLKTLSGEDESALIEAVVSTGSPAVNSLVEKLRLRSRFRVSLLAISRAGKAIKKRLNKVLIKPGDVLLLKGSEQAIYNALPVIGCLPLQSRGLNIGEPRRILLSLFLFGIGILSVALGYLQIQVAFVAVVMMMYFTGLLRLKEIYESIDWPIIVLLGALIPVAKAMESTGTAQLMADSIVKVGGGTSPTLVLVVFLIGTMFLSDLVNNATAAVLMVPIAGRVAADLGVSADPFLMSVAIGASCPFLTPIGHQCNALILGPGGYRFGDYWRVGLLLEVIIVMTALPLILWFWPF